MILLNKENIKEYLRKKKVELNYSKPLAVSMVGEEDIEVDGDGFLNYVFRVTDGTKKVIVKQGLVEGRVADIKNLAPDRIRLEYESMKIRFAIVPEYIPEVYLFDDENQIMVMEDVSHLSIARFQLNKSVIFPNLARFCGDFLARSHFYTSEYYLQTSKFRELAVHFTNHRMRSLFDDMTFLTADGDIFGEKGIDFDPEVIAFAKDLIFDPQVVLARYQLRDKFMSKAEALIHTDFHTSNIFIGMDEMKAIDMEYAHCGVMAYDLGYLQANFLSQYVCAHFRHFDSEVEREEFKRYALDTLKGIYNYYVEIFFTCWDEDAKDVYKGVAGLKNHVRLELLHDMIGYCCCSNMARCIGSIDYPEYSGLENVGMTHTAYAASVLVDCQTILKRNTYTSVEQWASEITTIMERFISKAGL